MAGRPRSPRWSGWRSRSEKRKAPNDFPKARLRDLPTNGDAARLVLLRADLLDPHDNRCGFPAQMTPARPTSRTRYRFPVAATLMPGLPRLDARQPPQL